LASSFVFTVLLYVSGFNFGLLVVLLLPLGLRTE